MAFKRGRDCDPPFLRNTAKAEMRRVYLIRHGTTEANERSLYYGATDVSLSEKGRAELYELSGKDGYPDAAKCTVFTRGMVRTTETLEILFPNTKYQTERDFREMDFGKFEMCSYEELKDDPEYQTWITGDFMVNACPGGEAKNPPLTFRKRGICKS